MQLACILERAKGGDFSSAERLPALWRREDGVVAGNAQTLFALIADEGALDALDHEIVAPDATDRSECADAATLTGSLRFVPVFIAGYRAAFGEATRMAMEQGLHNLLCSDPEVDETTPLLGKGPDGERALAAMAADKASRFGAATSFFQGQPLRAHAIAESIREALEDDEMASVEHGLSRLQAMFGFSRAALFTRDRAAPRIPAIRSLLDRLDYDALEEGVRYFFGHPVPL